MNSVETKVTVEIAQKLGLTSEEFDKIIDIMGRVPNFTELSIFSVMWSEHCSYKNSIHWLKTLPKKGEHLLVEAGDENAGLIDIGDGMACAFKIESHNHPSAIEPFQGAATGVGGIHRDIFTMGARPIASLNSLRFGDLDNPHTKKLVKGVVKGISHYGNCFGVPTVGGEVFFDKVYNQNILVNAMSVGIVKVGETVSASADGPGNPVFIVGSATGKDGIHGATFASADLTENSADDLPAVQVGDPFQEKLLLEATLEVIKTNAVVGMQDMGAAGITCSTSEMSAKSKTGMRIDLDKVPTRQKNMLSWEILLSESQERMLIVCKKGQEQKILDVFDKWDLECEEIGVVTDTGFIEFIEKGEIVAKVPADPLVLGGGAPVYIREYEEPAYIAKVKDFDIDTVKEPNDLVATAKELWKLPNLVSKRWVYEQYDSMVRTNTVTTNRPSDAAITRIKGSIKAIVMTTDCNPAYVHADPFTGTMIAVAEAARNIVCSGGEPAAITNCLNFGNPYDKGVYWQFVNAIKGMTAACEKFKTPVTGGNVSFYNQSVSKDKTEPVFPTPTIGMVGMIEDYRKSMTLDFKKSGDKIYLLGKTRNDINASEYLRNVCGVSLSPAPYFDLEESFVFLENLGKVIASGLVESAHDISDGGLFTNLLESAMVNNLGFDIAFENNIRKDAFLFGESQSRAVISVSKENEAQFMELLSQLNFDFTALGIVKENTIKINNIDFGKLSSWKTVYENTLGEQLD